MPDNLVISSFDELIVTIPHTLGFTPANSMVCIPLGGGGPIARVDLPALSEEIGPWVRTLTDVYARRHHPPRVALVAFGEDACRSVEALTALECALGREGEPPLEVGPVLWVNGEGWTDLVSGAAGVLDPSARARIDAEFALLGRVMPAACREDLVTALKGDPTGVAEGLAAAWERSGDLDEGGRNAEKAWLVARLDRFQRDRKYLSDADAARVLVAITDTDIRDAAAFGMSREHARTSSELWQDLVSRAPPGVRDTPATLLALSSFLEGRGAMAWVALDELSERNSLGDLIDAVLTQAVDPRAWEQALPAATGALLQQAAVREAAGPIPRPDQRDLPPALLAWIPTHPARP